jgi:small-conductance mechanosensitive channel
VYLLNRTRFGYFVGVSIALGGLFSALATPKYPGSSAAGAIAMVIALAAALAIGAATAWRRELQAHVTMAILAAGTVAVAALVVTAHLSGAFLDPTTHAPVAAAFPGYLRVSSVPFNAGGGLALVFGALYSAYIYMPKRRVLPSDLAALAIGVNFVASVPAAIGALLRGKLNSRVPATILIAVGALISGATSGLGRFGITWAGFLGEFLGVLLILVGFLVSEEVFRNVRLGTTVWTRRQGSLEREAG